MRARSLAWDTRGGAPGAYDTATGPLRRRTATLALDGEYRDRDARRARWSASPVVRSLRRAVPAVSARGGRGDLLDSARPGRGSRAADLARAAGLLLRLERARAPRQRHADGARHGAALCADRLLRCARRQRAVPGVPAAPITGEDLPAAQQRAPALGARRTPARAGALEHRHRPRSLPGDPGGHALSGARR